MGKHMGLKRLMIKQQKEQSVAKDTSAEMEAPGLQLGELSAEKILKVDLQSIAPDYEQQIQQQQQEQETAAKKQQQTGKGKPAAPNAKGKDSNAQQQQQQQQQQSITLKGVNSHAFRAIIDGRNTSYDQYRQYYVESLEQLYASCQKNVKIEEDWLVNWKGMVQNVTL